ncbi:unnamed protein product [Symbiodinium natans]|uniref:RING-type domain-containing protein n=1 Tax=Symbiodinium natans TaxID=878477 RepID=A0A812IGG6_9DINO|nr:unnamed protein product [Symbiodinium natans]
MAFAQRLSQRSLDTRRRVPQQWAAQQVAQFERKCEAATDRGGLSASHDCQRFKLMPVLEDDPNREAFRQALLQALQHHGFSRLVVIKEWGSYLTERDERLTIKASWDGLAEAPGCGPADGGAGNGSGFVGSCGICQEDRPLVALAPCGHALCQGCQQQLRGQPCPFCRQPVQGATRGLFMD